MIDVVFPQQNEVEFLKMAERLGFKQLVFVYPSQANFFPVEKNPTSLKIISGLLVEPSKIPAAKQASALALVKGNGTTRAAIERGAHVVFELEEAQQKDSLHYRISGLNQVLCRLANEQNVAIGFSFSSVLRSSGANRAQLLGKMMQNIVFCRKFKTMMMIGSFARDPFEMRAPAELVAFFTQLGMHPTEAKAALERENI
jgi:RNase P/RNase MRP subunit p30